jgi:hypothetical protein
MTNSHARGVSAALLSVVRWYFTSVYGRTEGAGVTPFYCDPSKVGRFAVQPKEIVGQSEAGLFRLFVGTAMFQARRDVLIMQQQCTMSRAGFQVLASALSIERATSSSACPKLSSSKEFVAGCDVSKGPTGVDCHFRPGLSCHVKNATIALKRTGDMGKLSTSAWLDLRQAGGFHSLLARAIESESTPTGRARVLVNRLQQVHRVGRKLATMFVSALSTPALASGLTPWFPQVDGNDLVVVDTNVARAIARLSPGRSTDTYDGYERWVRERATQIDLRTIHPGLPSYSPRLVQQAIYRFASKSNRVASRDPCVGSREPCSSCLPPICPFGRETPRRSA